MSDGLELAELGLADLNHEDTKARRKYKPYSEYKDSGVEWLGDVPEHWEVKKVKYNFNLQSKKVEIASQQVIALENIESWTGKYVSTDANYQGQDVAFEPGDILFGKLRPYLAKVYACNSHGVGFGDILVYRPVKEVHSRFGFYSFLNKDFIKTVDSSTYGSKMPRAGSEFINEIKMQTPPIEEQALIANFLDQETNKIELLIEKKQSMIGLLKEKRQAVISHAVTKGLNPNAPLKDSGIEWLGQIPEHWVQLKIKYFGKYKSGDFIPGETIKAIGEYAVYGGNGLRGFHSEHNHIGNYILIGRQGALCGNINYAEGKFWATEHAIVLHLSSQLNLKYIGHLLYTMDLGQYSVSAAQPGIGVENITNIYAVNPPLSEQNQIAEYLDTQTQKIDTLVDKSQQAIELLKERKTALISAVVTGKIDVRTAD